MLRKIILLLCCIAVLSACTAYGINDSKIKVSELKATNENIQHYGEFEIVESATIQRFINEESARQEGELLIVKDTETGCKYIFNNSIYESLTPLYNKVGEVEGCGENQ